jgi:23S rRNA pseudouridine2605 synthase
MDERLQKILAKAGYGSRRACEEIILGGRVKVNGTVARIGSKANPETDTIVVDGSAIPKIPAQFSYIALHKPRGVLSDQDSHESRQTVRDLVGIPGHLFAVGRLDLDSEGLILLTNDGELANKLAHPRYEHEKEYLVLLASKPDADQLKAWRRGVVLKDGNRTAPAMVNIRESFSKGCWVQVILHEGRKRQIRETASQLGLYVHRILRVRISTLLLGNLNPGEWRHLTPAEIRSLKGLSATPTNRKKNAYRQSGYSIKQKRSPKSFGTPKRD